LDRLRAGVEEVEEVSDIDGIEFVPGCDRLAVIDAVADIEILCDGEVDGVEVCETVGVGVFDGDAVDVAD